MPGTRARRRQRSRPRLDAQPDRAHVLAKLFVSVTRCLLERALELFQALHAHALIELSGHDRADPYAAVSVLTIVTTSGPFVSLLSTTTKSSSTGIKPTPSMFGVVPSKRALGIVMSKL